MKLLSYSYDDVHINPLQDFGNNKMAIKNMLAELV